MIHSGRIMAEQRYVHVDFGDGKTADIAYTPTPGELFLEEFAAKHGLDLSDAAFETNNDSLLSAGYVRTTKTPHNGLHVTLQRMLKDDELDSQSFAIRAVRYLVPGVTHKDLRESPGSRFKLRPDNAQAYGAFLASLPSYEEVIVHDRLNSCEHLSLLYIDGERRDDEDGMNAAEESFDELVERGLASGSSEDTMRSILTALQQFDPSLLR